MAGTDVLLAGLRHTHSLGRDGCLTLADEIERLNTALTDRDAQIERLEERCGAYKVQVEAGAAEIERLTRDEARLRKALAECAAHTGGHADGATVDFLMYVPENVRLHVERLKANHAHEVEDLCSTANANLESMLEQRARATTAERDRDEARAEVERLKGLLWYSWYEFNAIKARHGAPVDHYLMHTVDPEFWEQLTKAFESAIGPDDANPWPSTRARAVLAKGGADGQS